MHGRLQLGQGYVSGCSWGKGMCQAAVGVRVGLCVRVHLGQGYVSVRLHLGQGYVSGSIWGKGMCQAPVGARVYVRVQLR